MRIVYFSHALSSCWNHGNAHFLRGVLRELVARGHDVVSLEPGHSWSRENLLRDAGPEAADAWREAYPELEARRFSLADDPAPLVGEADLVLVHEWTDPALVARLGALRRAGGRFLLLFHDTHHRAVSDPAAMQAYDLAGYDGVLAFGRALAHIYRGWGWEGRVFVWHEAADTRLFRPPAQEVERAGAVWIGNWGDGERTAELEEFLLRPAAAEHLPLTIHGVRYPAAARALLERTGADYRGWLPNHRAPEVFARHLLTVHVPRRFYANQLPGIPTIRVFEALACGIPLVSAPWDDSEGLFTPGRDYLVASDGAEMRRHLARLRAEPELRASLAAHGLGTIRARHTCAARVDELLAIADRLRA
ncbi:MAG: glycosyltransferase [Acetobacteraceae bacterium]|nr:glycosyltransferase [Acetobacteraceae bacterium]